MFSTRHELNLRVCGTFGVSAIFPNQFLCGPDISLGTASYESLGTIFLVFVHIQNVLRQDLHYYLVRLMAVVSVKTYVSPFLYTSTSFQYSTYIFLYIHVNLLAKYLPFSVLCHSHKYSTS